MNVIHEYPPNFEEIVKVFPFAKQPGVIFTYGSAIYAPKASVDLPFSLLVHEGVHSDRQGGDPKTWWGKYLTDKDFRFEEELMAHIEEYKTFVGESRNNRRMALKSIAQRLASPLYGNMVSMERAKKLLKEGYHGGL